MQRFASSSVAQAEADVIVMASEDSEDALVPVAEEAVGEEGGAAGADVPPRGSPRKEGGNRLVGLDLMRGFIMIIMAWDHTKDIFVDAAWSPKHKGLEGWQGPFASFDNNGWWFFARAVSNVCAPGFFFTMGMSMSLFTSVRRAQGWTMSAVCHHFVVRSMVLLFVGRLVDPPFLLGTLVEVLKGKTVTTWNGVFTPSDVLEVIKTAWIGIFEVMTGLGLTMLTALLVLVPCAALFAYDERRRAAAKEASAASLEDGASAALLGDVAVNKGWLDSVSAPEWASYAVFVAVYAVSNVAIVNAQGDTFYMNRNETFPDFGKPASGLGETLLRLYVFPGLLPAPFGVTSYPVFPWLALTSLGIGMGFSMSRDARATARRLGLFSLLFLVGFVAVRTWGGVVGNYRGWPRGDGHREGDVYATSHLLGFFDTSKYPPSPAFTLLYLGLDFSFIYIFTLAAERMVPASAECEGQFSPMRPVRGFLYACKVFGQTPLAFYVAHFWILGLLSAIAATALKGDYHIPMPACVGLWLCLLAVLIPACRRYGAFKRTTPRNSVWRYF